MCGIAICFDTGMNPVPRLSDRLAAMNRLQKHRGPDGEGVWAHDRNIGGFGHVRLSIIDIESGQQPMGRPDESGNWIVFNGEVYNYIELRAELGEERFRTTSDTEVIFEAYQEWGDRCVDKLRGMFSFAIWDQEKQRLFCARDRFGIKPFYYTVVDGVFYAASECKALLPFLEGVAPDMEALKEYLTFQFPMQGRSLFSGIREVPPAHTLVIENGEIREERYWEVHYDVDWDHTAEWFDDQLQEVIADSMDIHIRADVPIGAYVSGGVDSSSLAVMGARRTGGDNFMGFNGRFAENDGAFDESAYARDAAEMAGFELRDLVITENDFVDAIEKVIYHLDYPVAGPGSFNQYMISGLAAENRKVVLGGQGGDEIFGGYTRYLIAYFEQCIKGAIEGTLHTGRFVVTYESIIPNLRTLEKYKPMLRQFWSNGLFEDMDRRYFQLVNRAPNLSDEIHWDELGDYDPYDVFRDLFYSENVGEESYFDLMTHFDFKTLLPALLQVEDRMSMAHGLESRVPLLDHPIVELAATMPADIKFKNGTLKMALVNALRDHLPASIQNRKDKMGFPIPLNQWIQKPGPVRDFVNDIFRSEACRNRPYFNAEAIKQALDTETSFGRKIWGLLCLELWHQQFIDTPQERI